MDCVLAPSAQIDIDGIWESIAKDNPIAAFEFEDDLAEKFSMLVAYPRMGRRCDELETGLFRLPMGNYVIFYRFGVEILEIARVIHGARKIEDFFDVQEDS